MATDGEKESLRLEQNERVMPLIGGLLDAWEGLSNDLRSTIAEEAPELGFYLDRINRAMELEDSDDDPIY
jgi:hypothetical protein